MNNVCRDCMLEKHLNRYPEGASEEAVKEYQEAVRRLTDRVGAAPSGPEVYCGIRAIRKRLFGEGEMEYAGIKQHFNALMLGVEEELERRVLASADPLKNAVQYAMMGNFIDFAALDSVEETKLMELLDKAPAIAVEEDCLELLRAQVKQTQNAANNPAPSTGGSTAPKPKKDDDGKGHSYDSRLQQRQSEHVSAHGKTFERIQKAQNA